MDSDPSITCDCCGAAFEPTDRFDIRFQLPDVAFADPDKPRKSPMDELLMVKGEGAFLRVLLPVRLSSGSELVLGTWMRVSVTDAQRAFEVWNDPAYAELRLEGELANAIKPWGDRLLGAKVTAGVRDVDEIPYVDGSTDNYVARVIGDEWDHDRVLERMSAALPFRVRVDLGDGWSIERTPGLGAGFADGYDRFTGPGRAVAVGVMTDTQGRGVEESFRGLTKGIRPVPDEDKVLIRADDEIRYAEAVTSRQDDGRTEHALFGLVVREGTALDIQCHYQDPADRAWALHVWRSASFSAPAVPSEGEGDGNEASSA
jgi:hypothetical protein